MRPEVEFLIACGALEDLLEGEEAAQLEAARAADPDVAARIAELEAVYAELGELTEVAPSDALWARIAGSVEAGERFADEAEVPAPAGPEITISLACAYCHDGLARRSAAYCASCLAPHHRECFAEHGRCSAPGCGETHWVRAQAPEVQRPQRRAPRLPLLLGALGLGSAAAALWFGAQVPSAQLADAPVSVAAPPPAPVPPGAPAREGGPRVLSVRGLDVSLDQGSADGIRLGERYALTPVVPADGLYAATWEVEVVVLEPHRARCVRRKVLGERLPLPGDLAVAPSAVIDRRPGEGVPVYYLEGSPGPRFQHLSRFLRDESGALLQGFLEDADREWAPPTTAGVSTLTQVRALSPPGGVVVLGPTRHAAAPRDLRAFVEGGGGLILCAGGAGQLREFGAEAALLSPVADLEGSASEVEGPLQVDARLRALAQEEPEALPRLRACRAVRPRAGAEVLLGDGARTPLIAQWRVGRGHVIYLGTDELWRLKQRDGALYRALWHELLGRVCAPAAGPPAGIAFPERGQAGSAQGSLPLGTPVRVNVFRATASSLLHVARLEGRVNGAGVSLEEHPHLPEGRCAWQASAEVAGAERVLGLGWWGSAAGVDPKALAGKPARELSREEWAEVEGWRLRKLLAEVARTAGQDVMGLTLDAESPWALQALDVLEGYGRLQGPWADGTLPRELDTTARALLRASWVAQERRVQRDLRELSAAVSAYRRDMGRYPVSLGHLTLRPHPSDPQREAWAGPYLFDWRPGRLSDDPWDMPYGYTVFEGDQGFELETLGMDLAPGGSGLACDRRWVGR